MEGYSGGVCVGRVGLLWWPGAGACPNLPQRRPGPGSTENKSPEYQRFSSGAPARSGPLWQIWTNAATAGPSRRATASRAATATTTTIAPAPWQRRPAHKGAPPAPRSRWVGHPGAVGEVRVIHRMCTFRRFRVPFPPVSRAVSAGFACRFRRFRRSGGRGRCDTGGHAR